MRARTLVIDAATPACSVALFADDALVADLHEEVGRGHAERLLPMVASLPGGGRAEHILVDVGPGSFTGIRVGIAAARGLALGWEASVAGYSSLALLAAGALADGIAAPLAAVLEGGHGEVFVQCFDASVSPLGDLASLTPDAARAAIGSVPAVGDGLRRLGNEPGARGRLPRAADAMRLPLALRQLAPVPLYGRAPDARLPTGPIRR